MSQDFLKFEKLAHLFPQKELIIVMRYLSEKEREIMVELYRDLELVFNQITIYLNSISELPENGV